MTNPALDIAANSTVEDVTATIAIHEPTASPPPSSVTSLSRALSILSQSGSFGGSNVSLRHKTF